MKPHPKALDLSLESLKSGQSHSFRFEITSETVEHFANVSGDWNPLHTDPNYAEQTEYGRPISHGAFQIALASQSLGMWLIGKRCLIGTIHAKFIRPLIFPAEVIVHSQLTHWSRMGGFGQTLTRISHAQEGTVYSEIRCDVGTHRDSRAPEPKAPETQAEAIKEPTQKQTIMITGASSGVIRPILPSLASQYNLVLISRREGLPSEILSGLGNESKVTCLTSDLESWTEMSPEETLRITGPLPQLWGVIHAAHPTPKRQSLLETSWDDLSRELKFSAYIPVVLGRILKANAGPDGGRLILIGSNYSIERNPDPHLLSYGAAKSSLVSVSKGLAHALAPQRITVNVVSPDFIAAGMNQNVHPRLVQIRAAENPSKLLCTPNDVLNCVSYLLDRRSQFVSGQDIALTGGRL